jgi:archaellum component FlaG (FlaF/FlaG flagellin family)
MTDTPESRLLLRLQSTGSNVNTWGGYLNTNQQMLARGSKGYEAIPMTGSTTLSWTNYSLTNQGAVRTIKLTGSLAAAANLVVPSVEMDFNVINATGQAVTVKTSAGTGIAVPNGGRMALYSDATDVYQASPTNISVFTPANAYDITTKTYVDTAIAAATTSTTPGTFRVTASDTTSKFANDAITVSGSLTKSVTNPGGNETLNIDFTFDASQQAYYQAVYFV